MADYNGGLSCLPALASPGLTREELLLYCQAVLQPEGRQVQASKVKHHHWKRLKEHKNLLENRDYLEREKKSVEAFFSKYINFKRPLRQLAAGEVRGAWAAYLELEAEPVGW